MKPGVRFALAAAVLFGASVPFSKALLHGLSPFTLAGLLYLGSGLGLAAWRLLRLRAAAGSREASLARSDLPWLSAAIFCGGIAAPALLLTGLRSTPAATGSLLLNLEGVFTALLAWFAFHEHFDRRIALGMATIVAGGLLLSWQGGSATQQFSWGALAIMGACLGWAADNNFTRKIAAADPAQIAMWKGLVAGAVNLVLGLVTERPHLSSAWAAAGLLGFLSYGVSLVCFVLALRHLGAARTGAYFSTAPFVGAALSGLFLREQLATLFWPAAGLMALGVWLHLSEHHEHRHAHEATDHEHSHTHDEHHQHEHGSDAPTGEPHSHWHRHEPLMHTHPHTPDLDHQHRHST